MYYLQLGWTELEGSSIGRVIKDNQKNFKSAYMVVNPSDRGGGADNSNPSENNNQNPSQDNSKGVYLRTRIPILEDFSYELKSEFGNMSDTISEFGSIASSIVGIFRTLNKLGASSSGEVGGSNEFLNLQVWNNTAPLRLTIKAMLHSRTNAYGDVYMPAMAIASQTIFTEITDDKGKSLNRFKVPGINMKQAKLLTEERKEGTSDNRRSALNTRGSDLRKEAEGILNPTLNKILTECKIVTTSSTNQIVEVLNVTPCFLESAKPTFSKEQTESGYPLWCEMELTIQSVFSAMDTFFKFNKPKPVEESFVSSAGRSAQQVFR